MCTKNRFYNGKTPDEINDSSTGKKLTPTQLFNLMVSTLKGDEKEEAKKLLKVISFSPCKPLEMLTPQGQISFAVTKGEKVEASAPIQWSIGVKEILELKEKTLAIIAPVDTIVLDTDHIQKLKTYCRSCRQKLAYLK